MACTAWLGLDARTNTADSGAWKVNLRPVIAATWGYLNGWGDVGNDVGATPLATRYPREVPTLTQFLSWRVRWRASAPMP